MSDARSQDQVVAAGHSHRDVTGGWLRPAVFGVMGGLVSNFALVAGVAAGAGAASIVMGTLTQRGTGEPQSWVVGFWGVLMGAVAVVMLLVGGNDAPTGLQSLTILVAAPFAIIMVMLCVAMVRDLRDDPEVEDDSGSRRGAHVVGLPDRGRQRW